MAWTSGQLAQSAVTTTPTSVLSPDAGQELIIAAIRVVNYSAAGRWLKVYHDEDGTTYDTTTIILPQVTIPAYSVYALTKDDGGPIIMGNVAGNLAVEAEANSALTVTVYGITRT